jgi:hypothetical protein
MDKGHADGVETGLTRGNRNELQKNGAFLKGIRSHPHPCTINIGITKRFVNRKMVYFHSAGIRNNLFNSHDWDCNISHCNFCRPA